MMRIAVCEDHAGDRTLLCETIRRYFDRMGYAGEISAYDTGEAFLENFSSGAFDMLMLDIYLPGMSGVELARKIRQADTNCLLFFVTVSLDHAMEGFEVQASGYVVKPVSQEKIDKALYMCRDLLARSARAIEIPNGRGKSLSLPLINIQYVEVYGKAVMFHLHGGVLEARLTLDETERALSGGSFLRCHRSFIVNMNHVEDIGVDHFIMKNGDLVPTRKNGRKEVKQQFARFMAGQTVQEVQL